MKKRIVAIMMAGMLAVSATACGGGSGEDASGNDTTQETDNASDSAEAEDPEAEVTYQSILDDYTKQIQDATPGLVDEYNTEAADKAGDLEALAELSNSKVEELAKICNDGVGEMADLMIKNGDDQETYEEWAGKLQDVYTEYAAQITDAYTDSTSDMSAEEMLESLQ